MSRGIEAARIHFLSRKKGTQIKCWTSWGAALSLCEGIATEFKFGGLGSEHYFPSVRTVEEIAVALMGRVEFIDKKAGYAIHIQLKRWKDARGGL